MPKRDHEEVGEISHGEDEDENSYERDIQNRLQQSFDSGKM